MAGAIGTLGRLGIGATSPVTYGLDFKSETFGAKQESMNGNGVRGTLEHTVERVRAGLIRIDGGIDLIIIETMSDLAEVEAAVRAVQAVAADTTAFGDRSPQYRTSTGTCR